MALFLMMEPRPAGISAQIFSMINFIVIIFNMIIFNMITPVPFFFW